LPVPVGASYVSEIPRGKRRVMCVRASEGNVDAVQSRAASA
jgi:hypothetical protein